MRAVEGLTAPICDLYLPGHCLHWIQLRKGSEITPRCGQVVSVEDGVITVKYLDRTSAYRNHQPDKIGVYVKVGGHVRVVERFGVLTSDLDQRSVNQFSIIDTNKPWRPCSRFESPASTTPEELAERLQERGGFSIRI